MTQIKNDSTVTFTQVYNDVKEGLHGLGEALKVGAEHVYEVLVRQQVVNSVSLLILDSVLILLTIFVAIKTPQWYKKCVETDQYEPWGALYIIPSVLIIVTVSLLFNTVPEIITGFVNPEYGAMKDIVNFIK